MGAERWEKLKEEGGRDRLGRIPAKLTRFSFTDFGSMNLQITTQKFKFRQWNLYWLQRGADELVTVMPAK
jgi:hypothetical protein